MHANLVVCECEADGGEEGQDGERDSGGTGDEESVLMLIFLFLNHISNLYLGQ